MKKIPEEFVNCYFKYDKKLVRVTGFISREKVIIFETVKKEDGEHCPHCKKYIKPQHWNEVESCLNFQGSAEKIETLEK